MSRSALRKHKFRQSRLLNQMAKKQMKNGKAHTTHFRIGCEQGRARFRSIPPVANCKNHIIFHGWTMTKAFFPSASQNSTFSRACNFSLFSFHDLPSMLPPRPLIIYSIYFLHKINISFQHPSNQGLLPPRRPVSRPQRPHGLQDGTGQEDPSPSHLRGHPDDPQRGQGDREPDDLFALQLRPVHVRHSRQTNA